MDSFTLRGRSGEDLNSFGRAEPREGEGEYHRKECSKANSGVGRLQDIQDKDRKDGKHCRQQSRDHGACPVNLPLVISHTPSFRVDRLARFEAMSDQAMVRAYYDVLHHFCERVGLFKIGGKSQVERFSVGVPSLSFFVLKEPIASIVQPPFEIGQLRLLRWIKCVELRNLRLWH